MPLDLTKPVTTDNYSTGVLPTIRGNDLALAKFLEGETVTGAQTGIKRYNSANYVFEYWNGSAWVQMPLNVSGNAATATKLQTARTISLSGIVSGSASFDGSANATINTSIAAPVSGNWFQGVPRVGSDGVMEIGKYLDFHETNATTAGYDGRLSVEGGGELYYYKLGGAPNLVYHSGNVNTANAGTATKLATARTISLTGGVTGSASFDGSADVSISATVAPYTGSDANFSNYPIGTTVVVNVIGVSIARNGSSAIYASSSNSGEFTRSSEGGSNTQLSGTWRSRGLITKSAITGDVYLFQRVA